MRVLLLDNYDSFTFNLYHYLEQLVDEIEVHRNDTIALAEVNKFDAVVLSPGPGLPSESGIMPDLIKRYAPHKPILGVCLGLQAIGEAYGASLYNLPFPLHGVAEPTLVIDPNEPIFANLPNQFPTGRYHSWVVDSKTVPPCLHITATDLQGHVMALRHKEHPLCGVQFHPESILTPHGFTMLENWVNSLKYIPSPSPLRPYH